MHVVGLTGGIGSGKSEVARRLAARGAWVTDADVLAKEAVAVGSEGLAEVVAAFGPEVLAEDGSLDRPAMAKRVFGDTEARKKLEGIIHPRVTLGFMTAMQAGMESGAKVIVYDVPLLFENKMQDKFTHVVVVDADMDSRQARVLSRDGMSAEEFAGRVKAQMPLTDKVAAATFVVDNRGDLDHLATEVDRLWEHLTSSENV